MKGVLRSLRNTDGVAAMEFALVIPFLLLIVFATIEYGWYLTQSIVLNNAVAEAARAGALARDWETGNSAAEDPEELARTAFIEALWIFEETFISAYLEVHVDETSGPKRIEVLVTEVPYTPITGYLGASILPETLAAKAVMSFP
ncbi:MAG: hypothetical protein CSA33_05365 [Desulfobulbus propionicus]|nr:MAG: hypothetical protein CSA33_05365 [Desulfobulbus propionicus]